MLCPPTAGKIDAPPPPPVLACNSRPCCRCCRRQPPPRHPTCAPTTRAPTTRAPTQPATLPHPSCREPDTEVERVLQNSKNYYIVLKVGAAVFLM